MQSERFPIPAFDGAYVHIYNPAGDVYRGKNTAHFTNGTFYNTWIPNDFSVLHENGTWHMVGITHPKPPQFHAFICENDVHEAEYQLFHCTAKGERFADVFASYTFTDKPKLLYPADRPNERCELWAPHFMKYNGRFQVIYSPQVMRRASSADMVTWRQEPPLFTCENGAARDPYIYTENGVFYCIYTERRQLKYRTSVDLCRWSDAQILQEQLFAQAENESPFLYRKNGIYYLLWSVYDGRNGCYDNRTFVFAGHTLAELYNAAPITVLQAHAPEIVTDTDGTDYLLSVFYPHNGISAVKLKWV